MDWAVLSGPIRLPPQGWREGARGLRGRVPGHAGHGTGRRDRRQAPRNAGPARGPVDRRRVPGAAPPGGCSGEFRADSGSGLRVVRIGTHALRQGSGTTLWTRLVRHKGQIRSGGGNHRASVFRRLVGTALIESGGLKCPTWDNRSSTASREVRDSERSLETSVSRTTGKMPFLWLAVEDEPGPSSLRGHIERNAIALLSNYACPAIDSPSASWLGNLCNREKIRCSGMWNSNHVEECHDPAFLDQFVNLISQAEKLQCSL